MKKILLVQPPQWYPITPHLAVPLLAGQLKANGFSVDSVDLNVKFYNLLLTQSFLRESEREAKEILSGLEEECKNADIEEVKRTGTYEEKTRFLKYHTIKKFFDEHEDEIPHLISEVENDVRTMKDPALFFDPERLPAAKRRIKLALRLASMPFAPNELDLDNYFANPLLNLDWDNIKKQLTDRSINMFYDYLNDCVSQIAVKEYDIICLSLTDLSQLIPVFTFARFLKERTNAKVLLGGNYATQIYEDIIKFPDILTDYIDFVTIGDGEIALCSLCRAIDGQIAFEDVPNLIYYDVERHSLHNTGFSCVSIDMDSLVYPDFTGYDFEEYFTPEIVFPVQISKGCYWGKCTFCDYAYGQQGYSPKHIPRVIDELRFLIDRYGASKFIFVDEAIPPSFYNRLALAIIESGLKINYYSFARLEDGYTPEVFRNLYLSGARLFLWGYECESLRIMEKMNKGINAENRIKILSDAREAGIWNNGLFIFGYPTETMEEISATMEVIRKNRRIIPSCTFSNFTLKKHAQLIADNGDTGVLGYVPNGDFYSSYKDSISGVIQEERRALRRNFQFDYLDENAHKLWPVVFSDFDHLLLYLSHYGCDFVCDYVSPNRICPDFR